MNFNISKLICYNYTVLVIFVMKEIVLMCFSQLNSNRGYKRQNLYRTINLSLCVISNFQFEEMQRKLLHVQLILKQVMSVIVDIIAKRSLGPTNQRYVKNKVWYL